MGLSFEEVSRLSKQAQLQILNKSRAADVKKVGKVCATRQSNKYGAKKTWVDGVCFDSRLEARYYENLKLLHRAGAVAGYLHHGKIVLAAGSGPDARAMTYEPDFVVLLPDGTYKLVDTKGVETAQFRDKMKILRERFPGIEITITREDAP